MRGAAFLSYRITQILSGHGCLGEYLHRIGAETHPGCQECGAALDNTEHMRERCLRFAAQRQSLKDSIGQPASTEVIARALTGNDHKRMAASTFCDQEKGGKRKRARKRNNVQTSQAGEEVPNPPLQAK